MCQVAAESLPSTTVLEQHAAAAMQAELQILLAEVKRLSTHQEHLKREVTSMTQLETAAAAAKPNKSAELRLNGCKMTDCPGPVLVVPFGKQWTAGSSDWSEAAAETPVRNVISGTVRCTCNCHKLPKKLTQQPALIQLDLTVCRHTKSSAGTCIQSPLL